MAFILPPSVASGLATAGSVGLQALPGLAVLGVGFTTIKLLEHRPTKWEKTKSVIKDVGEVMAVLTAVGAFIKAVTGNKKGEQSVSEADINNAIESRAKEMLQQHLEFNRRVEAAVAAETQAVADSMNQMTALLAEERAQMDVRINQAVSEDPDEVVEVPVTVHPGAAAKINKKRAPVVRKAAGG